MKDGPVGLGLEVLQELVDVVVKVVCVDQHLEKLAHQKGAYGGLLVIVLLTI